MKRHLLIAFALVMALVASSSVVGGPVPGSRRALAPGDPAPPLTGRLLDTGADQTVEWSRHRLTLVNFWATWCVPCQEEMPALQALQARRAADGLQVIGVNLQEISNLELESFVYTLDVRYPILRAVPRVNRDWGGIAALPATFLVDSRGMILRRYVGAAPEQVEGLLRDVDVILDGGTMEPLTVPSQPRMVSDETEVVLPRPPTAPIEDSTDPMGAADGDDDFDEDAAAPPP